VRSVRPVAGIAAVLLLVVVAGCDVASSDEPSGSVTPTLGPGATPTDIPNAPDDTSGPGETDLGIPGYDGWHLINGADVDLGSTDAGLAMTLTKRALWFQASKGVLFYTTISGDFRITSTVETSKTSDSSQDPGGDGTTQLAGIMARAQTPQENYVFIAVGSDSSGLSVETKSTTNNDSKFEGPAWPTGDAELKLCRIGTDFTLWKRAIDSGDDFTLAATFKRPDLTGELQVGANLYSDSTPDITALFPDLTVEPLDPGEAC
jgi:hypothetical protein